MRSSPEPEEPAEGWNRAREAPSKDAGRSAVGFYLTAGLTFGAALLLFTGAGYWLDTKLATLPLLTIAGAILGGAGGFLHLYRSLAGIRQQERRGP